VTARATIRSKLALGLFAIAIVLLLPLAIALRSLTTLHQITTLLQTRDFAASLVLNQMRSGTDELRRLDLAILVVKDSKDKVAMDSQLTELQVLADSLKQLSMASAAARISSGIRQVQYFVPLEYQAAAAGNWASADSISKSHLLTAVSLTERELTSAERLLRDRSSRLVAAGTDETTAARRAAALGLAVGATLALIISILLWRSISRPVRDLEQGMAAVADGDFGHRLSISPSRRDEFGHLAQSFSSMAQQLAALDRLKAEFVSIASHELKTPINVILGYLQLIEEEVYGPVAPKMREIIRTLDAQTRSLARLVHQLLDMSRFEAGGSRLDLRPTKLSPFLADLEETFQVLALQRDITFRIEHLNHLPAEVLWDPDRVSEVLGNLLSNAFKFTERGGMVELLAGSTEDAVQFIVRDTGVGIPPLQLQHVFEKFYQADNQESASHGGTGLGLAIARQIVQAHGGTISVESTVSLGTTFQIVLPIRSGQRIRAVPPSSASGVGVSA